MPAEPPKPLDLAGLRRRSIEEMSRKVAAGDLARVVEPTEAMARWVGALPRLLAGAEFADFVAQCVTRRRRWWRSPARSRAP